MPPAARTDLARLGRLLELEPAWVRVLPINPIPALFRRGPPGVQLRLLSVLAPKKSDEAAAIIKDLGRAASWSLQAARIRKRQRPDGTWPVKAPEEPREAASQLSMIGLVENLHALAVLGGHHRWPAVGAGLRALLAFQKPDGRFPLPYQYQAAIGRLLMALGQRRTPAVHRAAHWIAERQRADGGWLYPQMAGRRTRAPSCLWTTAEVLAFLARYPTVLIKERLHPAGEFLLQHALEANTTALLPEASAWDILEEGSRGVRLFHGGTLKVL
ncbi:MAG: hypothetical protein V3U35_01415, partial [Candidatus Neomarinimicrobiota bacterium]